MCKKYRSSVKKLFDNLISMLVLLMLLCSFFFSERIGWVPIGNEIPDAVKDQYTWIEGLSVTEMEIMHGAYRKDNPNGRLIPI